MRRIATLIGLMSALLAVFVTPAWASPESTNQIAAHARQIAAHSAAGYLTAADRQWAAGHRDVAAAIIDPARTRTGEVTDPAPAASGTVSILATSCKSTNRYQIAYTLLGFRAWEYHTHVRWCYTGSSVTSVPEHYGYFANVDSQFYPREVMVNVLNYYSANQQQAFTQQRIENCVLKYGCIGSASPWNRVNVYGNGTNSYSWGG
jgi:hypothetical protein